jgi:hypothetical protein
MVTDVAGWSITTPGVGVKIAISDVLVGVTTCGVGAEVLGAGFTTDGAEGGATGSTPLARSVMGVSEMLLPAVGAAVAGGRHTPRKTAAVLKTDAVGFVCRRLFFMVYPPFFRWG